MPPNRSSKLIKKLGMILGTLKDVAWRLKPYVNKPRANTGLSKCTYKIKVPLSDSLIFKTYAPKGRGRQHKRLKLSRAL